MIVKDRIHRIHRDQLEMFSIEEFVSTDHLLRKIDSAVDFKHIYDLVEDLYCKDTVIVDDGWQTDDSSGGYAYCGDWEPAPSKVGEMKKIYSIYSRNWNEGNDMVFRSIYRGTQ